MLISQPGRNNNAYRRMTGQLRLNDRSAILETLEDSLIYLVTSYDLMAFDDGHVVAEGQLSAVDRLGITWIGIASN